MAEKKPASQLSEETGDGATGSGRRHPLPERFPATS